MPLGFLSSLVYATLNLLGLNGPPVYDAIVIGYVVVAKRTIVGLGIQTDHGPIPGKCQGFLLHTVLSCLYCLMDI